MTKFWNLPFGLVLMKHGESTGPVDLLKSLSREIAYLQQANLNMSSLYNSKQERFIEVSAENHQYRRQIDSLECDLNMWRSQAK